MKIAVALGGGGAKGYAHIGIIRALLESGVKIDIVTGTSIGAFVGAIFADGGIEELEEFVLKIKFSKLPQILTPAFSRLGLLSGDYAKKLLDQFLDVKNIEDLSIPFAVVATDINNGKSVTFTSGSIKNAIRASIAIPGLITPVLMDDCFLVDGGATDPVPVEAARKLGADIVIAVDLVSNFKPFTDDVGTRRILKQLPFQSKIENLGDYIKTIGESLYLFESKKRSSFSNKTVFDIIQRISVVTQARLIETSFRLTPPDIVLRPEVSNIGILDFHKAKQGIEAGQSSIKDKIEDINKIISGKN